MDDASEGWDVGSVNTTVALVASYGVRRCL